MKLKAVSGIMLTLLFIGMLTLAFNICEGLADGSARINFHAEVTLTEEHV